jgi:hypothetical protein
MSKARLAITAVVVEGRSQGEVARAYGVSQGWVSRLVARYRAEGQAAFEPRSRRPKSSPRAISDATACGARIHDQGGGLRSWVTVWSYQAATWYPEVRPPGTSVRRVRCSVRLIFGGRL